MKHQNLVDWIRSYRSRPGNGCGGSLHIVLDDKNADAASVRFCRGWAIDHGDAQGEMLATALLRLSPVDLWDTVDPNGAYHEMGTTDDSKRHGW